MKYFGIDREVRAVDDITLHVNRNEIYGLAGESSSGKTSFIKTIAAANRPPLNVVGGSVKFSFLDRDIHALGEDETRGGAMEAPLLHHAGFDERAQSGSPDEALLLRLRLRPSGEADARVRGAVESICGGSDSSLPCSMPIRTSFPAECASA